VIHLVQACYSFTDDNVINRGVEPLKAAMKCFNLKEACIITADTEIEWMTENVVIKAVPAWKWMLNSGKE
jgi:uncharacterized protein